MENKNAEFEYVMSGISYIDMASPCNLTDEKNEWYNKCFEPLQNVHNHTFSILFNGFVEKKQGELFTKFWKKRNSIYVDSGGLQIVTRGLNATDAMKDEVYKTQALWGDYGMCFDEIPVFVDGKSIKGDLSCRFYSKDLLEPAARQTGKNLRRQIEVYKELNSNCHPILIVQGNDYDSYMRWVEYALDELPSGYADEIGGIGIGGASLGKGYLEEFKKCFYCSQLPIDLKRKHFHILGVGAVYKLLPILMFKLNGLYDNSLISYDSTTQTRAITNGIIGVWEGELFRMKQLGFHAHDAYKKVYDEIMINFPFYDEPFDEFHWLYTSLIHAIRVENAYDRRFKTMMIGCANSVLGLMKSINRASQSLDNILETTKTDIEKSAFKALVGVKTREDYEKWEDEVGFLLDTQVVKTKPEKNLMDLF